MAHEHNAQRHWARGVGEDVRFALRLAAKERWFTLAALVTLGLGLTVSTGVFAIANGVLLRPLGFPGADRLVHIGLGDSRTRYGAASYAEYVALQEARTVQPIAAFADATMTLAEDGYGAERLQGAFLSASALDLLDVIPIVGRVFSSDDDLAGGAPGALLAESVWTRRYARDPLVIGRPVRVNGVPTVITGVLPDAVGFPGLAGARTEIWQPLGVKPGLRTEAQDDRTLGLIGRIAVGASLATVNDEMTGFASRLQQGRSSTQELAAIVVPLRDRYIPIEVEQLVLVLLGAGTLVLVIALVNVLNLSIVRAASRQDEIATRVAVGATRWHITRQLLIESAILATGSGLVAAVLSAFAIRLFASTLAVLNPPFWVRFTFDGRVAIYLACICAASCLVISLTPILHMVRTRVQEHLYGRGGVVGQRGRARRVSQIMVAAEVALTAVLLAGGGLMMRAFLSLYSSELGFDTRGVVVLRVDLSGPQYAQPDDRARLTDQLEERLRTTPVLRAATIAAAPPGGGGPGSWALTIDRRPAADGEKPPMVTVAAIGDDYFKLLNRPVLAGRSFVRQDGAPGQRTAIVNERFVSTYFPSSSPIGHQINVDRTGRAAQSSGWMEIVGVVPSMRERDALLQSSPEPVVYIPYRALPSRGPVLVVHGPDDWEAVLRHVRTELVALDPDLPVFDVRRLDDVLAFSRWPQQVFGGILMGLALVALVLASVGVYGITAHAVATRRREIAVRMALGAQQSQVVRLMWWSAFLPLMLGLSVGGAVALSTGQLLDAFLVDVNPREPLIFTFVPGVLLAVGLFASVIPARRASVLDPLVALRHD